MHRISGHGRETKSKEWHGLLDRIRTSSDQQVNEEKTTRLLNGDTHGTDVEDSEQESIKKMAESAIEVHNEMDFLPQYTPWFTYSMAIVSSYWTYFVV